MGLRTLTNGKIAGAGTLTVSSALIGGICISTDGTNAAAVRIYRETVAGTCVFDISSKQPLFIAAPIECGLTIAYDISGTGASAQLYEHIA